MLILSTSLTLRPASPQRLIRLGALLGVGLIGIAMLVIGLLRGQNLYTTWFDVAPATGVEQVILGAGLGMLFSAGLWYGGGRLSGFMTIRDRIAATIDLPAMRLWQIVAMSLLAAIPEEIFFRGALQPLVGLIFAALIFGILHAVTPLYFAYATVAGLGLGLLAQHTNGVLWMPIAAHFAIDMVSLLLLRRWARHTPTPIPTTHKDY